MEQHLPKVLKQSVAGRNAPALPALELQKTLRRRKQRQTAAVLTVFALLLFTSPFTIAAASRWAPVLSFREAIEARLLSPAHRDPSVRREQGPAPNPVVVTPESLGDRGYTFGYLPAGFAAPITIQDGNQVGTSATGPDGAFVSLRFTDDDGPVTVIVDYAWQRPIRHQDWNGVMYADQRSPDEIRIRWSVRTGSGWRNFELIARAVPQDEVERVFINIKRPD